MAPLSPWLAGLAFYALAVLSAVVPWVNAEVLMISAVPVAHSLPGLAALVVAVTAGQMTGKSAVYWLARTSSRRSPRWQGLLDRWRKRLERHPRSGLSTTFMSALVGFPPFFVVSIAAGALNVAFTRFLVVGTVGRLAHFALVAYAPALLRRMI